MQETQIQPLGWEDPLEKEMTTHSSLAWRIPWTEEPGGLLPTGSQRVRHNSSTKWQNNNHHNFKGCHSILSVESLQSCLTRQLNGPWRQASLSMGFSRQGYCSGLPCPSPGDLPNPGMEPLWSHNWIQLTNNVFPED